MHKKTFNKNCRLLWGKLKKGESRDLPLEDRHEMLLYVVKRRHPVHPNLITDLLDRPWIHAMGYLYETKGFLHTCEHTIK